MKQFSLYSVPQEEAADLLEQLRKYQAAQGSLEDVSKLQSRITELQVCVSQLNKC
jgi:hypothetical protein